MSSENCVRIVMAENLRFPGEGSSALGKPGAKARPKGVVDAQTVEIPSPPKNLNILTHDESLAGSWFSLSTVNPYGEVSRNCGEKRYMYVQGARTVNRHR